MMQPGRRKFQPRVHFTPRRSAGRDQELLFLSFSWEQASSLRPRVRRRGLGAGGGGALQEQRVAAVAHAHGLGVGRQGQLAAGARVAEDVATVAAVVLADGEAVRDTRAPWPTQWSRSPSRPLPQTCHNLEGLPLDGCVWGDPFSY